MNVTLQPPLTSAPQPVLIACAHGTRSPEGQRCIDALRAEIAARRPGLRVLEAYVDVQADCVAAPLLPAGTAVLARIALERFDHAAQSALGTPQG